MNLEGTEGPPVHPCPPTKRLYPAGSGPGRSPAGQPGRALERRQWGPWWRSCSCCLQPSSPRPIYPRAGSGTAPAALPRARHKVNRPGSAFRAAPHGPAG